MEFLAYEQLEQLAKKIGVQFYGQKDEKDASIYKQGELHQNLRIFYEWTDPNWIFWLQQVFWNLYRNAPMAQQRLEELEKIF